MQKQKRNRGVALDGKALMMALGLFLLAAVPLRTVQLFTNIEPHTGFFAYRDWTVYTVYAVVAVGILTLAILPACSARLPAPKPISGKHKGAAVGSFLFAAGIAYDVTFTLVKIIRTLDGVSGKGLFAVLFSEGAFAMLLQAACGVAACIFMVMVGLSFTGEQATYSSYKLLALMPLFWTMFRLVGRFMTKISFTMVSELLLELALLCFMMLFLLSFARVTAQIGQETETKKLVCFGMPAAFLSLLIGITRLICTIGGRTELLADGFAFSLADLTFGIFLVCYLYTHMRCGVPPVQPDAEV